MSYKNEQLLTSTLIMHPKDLTNDIDNVIKYKLKESIEGRCYEDGYIVKDSIRIVQRSIGNIVTNNKKSEIKYVIKYKAEIISPSVNDEINIIINSINKMVSLVISRQKIAILLKILHYLLWFQKNILLIQVLILMIYW